MKTIDLLRDNTTLHRYRIQEFGDDGEPQTDRCVVEAPSPGVAVEAFLAFHGMLRYDTIRCSETDEEPTEPWDWDFWCSCQESIADFDGWLAVLDKHHVWQEW